MQNFYQKLEHLVYLQNYTNPLFPKESALMCIHAVLSQRENVPRIYLVELKSINPVEKQAFIWNSISSCLLSDHKAIYDWTLSSLKLLHISAKEIQNLSNDDKVRCLNLIEEHLESNLGAGRIYYEMSRFTPFHDDDISQILIEANAPTTIWQATLYRRLRERTLTKIQYHHKYINLLQKINLRCDWDMFHKVYKFKLEQVWQNSWLNLEKYQVDPNIINTIVVGDCFED